MIDYGKQKSTVRPEELELTETKSICQFQYHRSE